MPSKKGRSDAKASTLYYDACGLCDKGGDLDCKFYGEAFHRACVNAVRSKVRLMLPADKAKDKKDFVNDKETWKAALSGYAKY